MEPRESPVVGQKCTKKEKTPLQRNWASEPSASTNRSTFPGPDATRNPSCEGQPCDEVMGTASGTQQKYPSSGNPGTHSHSPGQDTPGTFPQGFPRGYSYQLGQPYPQHPQTERFLSGAKPQPGLEPHAWPFAGQLPSDELYPAGHSGHPPHRAAGGRFPRQKSPSLPSSFGQYSQSSLEPGEDGYGKKDQKPKKPGKYICHYCSRACAKPSVLKKHIRSHTGERPYPCVPCGFSFKTKSNLYKHRKSHAHAIKAGLVPFSEMGAGARGGDLDQASLAGDVHSDGEQSTDTDEEGLDGCNMLMDKDSPGPQGSFESDKQAGGVEPAYADSAEQLGSMKVPILIVPKTGGVPAPEPSFPEMKGPPHHMPSSQAGALSNPADNSPSIKQRLALRLKQGQEPDSTQSQTQNLLSPHSKGSTDSGYFSRSESAEQQISSPNNNIKSYEEIMFGRTWYRPVPSRQSITVSMASAMGQVDPSGLASLKKSGAILEMGKIAEDHFLFKGDGGISGDPKQYATGPCQSSTGLLEPPSDSATLIRSNSMPISSPTNLSVPTRVQGSQSFDEMMTSDDVFCPAGLRRLQRQAAFEHTAHEAHAVEAEAYGHVPKNSLISMGLKMGERSPGLPEHVAYTPYGTKVGMSEIATRKDRKRRKKKSVGDEEDSPGQYDSSCSGSVEMIGDYDSKQGSLDGSRGTPTGKGSLYSAHSQSDSFDTCASMCSDDMALLPDSEGRKAVGNVISVIQHTNSLSRPNSFEKSESFDQLAYHPTDKVLCSQYSEQSDTDIFEDALSPESTMQRTESMEQQLQSDSDLASVSSSPAMVASPGQPYHHIPHKLVRQPNIQVPEIRVTEEPDKPEKEAEVAVATSEPERQEQKQQQPAPHVVEEFQLPQRSDTLSQMPSEKLPPKKKRLRLADIDHSSGESSFESTCTSLSRSPSQESNLSYYSSFSMSFDREENIKSVSPTKQEDGTSCCGTGTASKQSEFLTVPGSGHSSHHQQREMRRSSSEQAPCALATEFPEMRSKSFDYGSLSPWVPTGGDVQQRASLSVYPEAIPQEPGGAESSVKPDGSEHGSWPGQGGPGPAGAELVNRTKRTGVGSGSLASLHQHCLQQSISEDSLQDGPTNQRSSQHRLQKQSSSMDSEPQGQEVAAYPSHQPSGQPPYWAPTQEGAGQRPRMHHGFQTPQQHYPNLHIRGGPADGQSEGSNPSQVYAASRASPHNQHQQQQLFRSPSPKLPASSCTSSSTSSFSCSTSFSSPGPAMLHQVPPGVLVPVRVHTHVPSYGSATYTSVSHLLANHSGAGGVGVGGVVRLGGSTCTTTTTITNSGGGVARATGGISGGISGAGFNLLHFLGQPDTAAAALLLRQHPLSSSSSSYSSTCPSSSSSVGAAAMGGSSSKRMLSPASSLELFFHTKQQKRVRDERMYGQILRDMGAVELGGAETGVGMGVGGGAVGATRLKSEGSADDSEERMSSSPPPPPPRGARSPPPDMIRAADQPPAADSSPSSSSSLERHCGSPQSMASTPSSGDETETDPATATVPAADKLLPSAARELQQLFQLPSLRTATCVSWCFLNYTKPSSGGGGAGGLGRHADSVYASWCVSAYNPNPLGLSTKAALALLRSDQRRGAQTYTTAATAPPSTGKLVVLGVLEAALRPDHQSPAHQITLPCITQSGLLDEFPEQRKLKPELMPVEVCKLVRKMKGVVSRDRSKEEQGEKEVSSSTKAMAVEPTRIKIFEGGCVNVRRYSPSQSPSVFSESRATLPRVPDDDGDASINGPRLPRRHGRTVPGNLTKHMKSKAHMKKCLELGVSVSSVEDIDTEDAEGGEEGQRASGKAAGGVMPDHQFSDADDSDGGEDDEVDDEDDDDEDDYDGDSTPKSRSRSTSPLPYGLPSLSITSVAASHPQPPPPPPPPPHHHHHHHHHHPSILQHHGNATATVDLLGNTGKPPMFGYFTTVPSIQITPQPGAGERADREAEQAQYHRALQGALGSRLLVPPSSSSMDEDPPSPSPELYSPCSRLSSPGLDPACSPSCSPSSSHSYSPRRYLSPRRDLSPCAGRLSPRRDLSPLRHISPKRELGVGGYRRELSPRRELSTRGHLSPTASPLSRPGSPAGRDYKRDLSPRGRHRGPIRPLSPRRGLHHHQHHLQSHQTGQQVGTWSQRQALQPGQAGQGEPGDLGHPRSSGSQMETTVVWSPASPQRFHCGSRCWPFLHSWSPAQRQTRVLGEPAPLILRTGAQTLRGESRGVGGGLRFRGETGVGRTTSFSLNQADTVWHGSPSPPPPPSSSPSSSSSSSPPRLPLPLFPLLLLHFPLLFLHLLHLLLLLLPFPEHNVGPNTSSSSSSSSPSSSSSSSGQQAEQGRNHGNQPVLFSHLPLHSQLQVRSPFPMVPIGGIQMVHSPPGSVTPGHAHTPPGHAHTASSRHAHITPPGHAHGSPGHAHSTQQQQQQQQQPPPHRLPFQKSGSDDSGEVTSCHPTGAASSERGGGGGGGGGEATSGGGAMAQEQSVQTCTEAIASLCIDGQEGGATRDPPPGSPQPHPHPHPASPPSPAPTLAASHHAGGRSQQHFSDLKFSSPSQADQVSHPPPAATPTPTNGPAQTPVPPSKPRGSAPKAPEEREK
ncbi:hypothetical protein CRUP_024315 [Coryphaenoides rupestris]|nr:hypothetical protein CRUP_024315 [Coryphaenoides rupestris]